MLSQELKYKYKALKALETLGVSLGKTHYLLKSLIDIGWVKLDNFQKSNNKLSYAYFLTPMGILEKSIITARFLSRKKIEFNKLRIEIEQLQKEVEQHATTQE